VACVNTGARFETYVVRGEAGSGVICINGAPPGLRSGRPCDLSFSSFLWTRPGRSPLTVVVVVIENNLFPEVLLNASFRYPGRGQGHPHEIHLPKYCTSVLGRRCS
jgi:hypothetical protein